MKVGFPYLTKKGKLTIAFADEVTFDPTTATLTAELHGWPGVEAYQPKWLLIFGSGPGVPPYVEKFDMPDATVKPGDNIHLSIKFNMPWDRR